MQMYCLKLFHRHLLVLLLAALTVGCQIDSEPKSELDRIREQKVLRVGTLNNQLSYYIGTDGPAGLDYELAEQFAEELNVKLEIKPAYRLSSLFPALERGEIDLIAAGISQSPLRKKKFRAGPAYYYVSQQVVYKKGKWRPKNIKPLIDKQDELLTENQDKPIFTVIKDSHFEETLLSIQKDSPDFKFHIENNADVNDLLKQVSDGDLLFTIADSVEVSLAQRIYPDIAVAFELSEDQPISWYIRSSEDESLYAYMIEFFGSLKQSNRLASLEEKYIGHVNTFDYVDTREFIRALDSKLPEWAPLFKKYAGEFDWRLIAAIAYQESHWDPLATSPTGVRGMMMLTQPTAKSVKVNDRLDPEESIRGGVEYLRRMLKRIPDAIPEHEKIWFALASYNLGYGHIMDARRLTKAQGGDNNSWTDVKDRLPLLRQKQYFSNTRYGYARGDEARMYVENIRRYHQSIVGHIEPQGLMGRTSIVDGLAVIPPLPSVSTINVPIAESEPTSSEEDAASTSTNTATSNEVNTPSTDAATSSEENTPSTDAATSSEENKPSTDATTKKDSTTSTEPSQVRRRSKPKPKTPFVPEVKRALEPDVIMPIENPVIIADGIAPPQRSMPSYGSWSE